ncbi:MAG: tetratricopeptide repeat protein [marine benthic group bacterium]|nr:tetratricopeptide repeat protein [Gemmatimonadota bacterium]
MSETPGYQRLFAELKRRNVFRVMTTYGVVSFIVLQVADIAFPGLGLPEWTITLVLVLTLIGFPIAVVLAWAFEMTPQGVKKTEDAAPGEITQIISAPAARRWPAGVLALLGVCALVVGAWWAGRSTAPGADVAAVDTAAVAGAEGDEQTARDAEVLQAAYADLAEDSRPSIAVLPSADMSPDGDQEYFADGMTEELLNTLAKIRQLRVAGRTSAFAYKGQDKDLREIGRELGVRYVVEGSVRKQDDRLRITAQLVDAGDNFHLWSEAYDRTMDDVFAIQEEIAGAIAAQLQVSLGLEEGGALVAPIADIEAYEMYLTARAGMRERGSAVLEAVRLFEEVVARDSTWAPAWAGLAQAYTLAPFYTPGNVTEQIGPEAWGPALAAAEEAAVRALRLDPGVAGAEVALGNVFRDRWEWDLAEVHYLRALALDPDDGEAHQQYGEMLAAVGRQDEALRSARRALALDPTSTIRGNVVGYILLLNDRPEESIAQLRAAIVHGAEIPMPYENLSRAHLFLRNLDEAERWNRQEYIPRLGFDEATRTMWDGAAAVRFESFRNGDRAAYDRCCAGRGPPSDYIVLGDTLAAIEALSERYRDLPRFNANALNPLWRPDFDGLRDDPRFQDVFDEILAHAGLEGAELKRAPAGE